MNYQHLSPETATQTLKDADPEIGGVQSIQFTKCNDYASFIGEHAVVDDTDIVFHFFISEELNQWPNPSNVDPRNYWLNTFPAVLSEVSQEFFSATKPRLIASYVPELASYWMRAYGFAVTGDPDMKAAMLFKKLNEALEKQVGKVKPVPKMPPQTVEHQERVSEVQRLESQLTDARKRIPT